MTQLWSEDAESVMVHGIENSLDASLQAATTGMAKWLKHHRRLNDSEIAAVLGTSVRYEIAAIVNTRPHVVSRLSKATLDLID